MSEQRMQQADTGEVTTHRLRGIAPVEDLSRADVDDIVYKLGSKKREEREAAEQAIAQMGPAAVEALLDVVKVESAKYQKQRRCFRWGMAIYLAMVLLPLLFVVVRGMLTGVWKGFGDYFTFASSMSGVFGGVAAASRLHKNVATALASVGDVRAIGALIEVLELDDKGVRYAAAEAVTRLLPQVRESDAGLLTEEHRRILNRAVLKSRNPHFIVAVLSAYRYVGTGGEVETATALAEGKGHTAGAESVRRAAQECLPVLEERAAREKEANILVRAAANPAEPSVSLLRPAGNTSAAEQELLRPANHLPSD